MSQQFEKWQQQYQQSAAPVNIEKLTQQLAKAHKRERLKAWGELILGFIVSIFCVYSAIYSVDKFTNTMLMRAVFLALSPIPIGFSIWAFKFRQKHWQQQSLNLKQLLSIKRKQALSQLHYWQVSALVVSALWLCLVLGAVLSYLHQGNISLWGTLVLVNAIVVIATVLKFFSLKRNLWKRLQMIDSARD